MDAIERKELIALYGRGYDDLIECLDGIPKEIWQFKPEPSEWSVHEIIVHLADSETNSALRARLLMTEPGKTLMAYDQDLWVGALDYHSQSWQDALEGLKWARKTTFALLQTVDDNLWENSGVHPEFDEPYTFELWLKIYSAHIPAHIDQIQQNYKIWKSR